ncbi:type II toxin-antitoxin system RelE/ParE family toxin [uncultured Parabacteroides sp.]|uniref:type II toxin-antitoxin system RelE/ParE family toxin n=1 Tax=uncultured Parabacteroides sp. TaxID=512312 RepID=UPI002597BF86|nr:type II toxin-antitoxin system RelE/ParE family toxin [uncultured Parabacteroides sp.]
MKYEIELGSKFKHSFKRLRKKYHSLDKDLESLVTELVQNPTVGADLGNGVRKVRMAISDKGKGKSHGARVILILQSVFTPSLSPARSPVLQGSSAVLRHMLRSSIRW